MVIWWLFHSTVVGYNAISWHSPFVLQTSWYSKTLPHCPKKISADGPLCRETSSRSTMANMTLAAFGWPLGYHWVPRITWVQWFTRNPSIRSKCGFLPIVHIIQWVIAFVVWLTQLSLSPKGPCKKVLPGTGYLLASAPGWITTHRVVLILSGLGWLGPLEKVEDMNDWKRLVRMCGNASRASWSLVPKFIKILKFAFDHVCFMSVSILKAGLRALPTSTINFNPRNGCCRWTISSCSGHPEDRCRLGRFPCFPVLPLFLVRGRLCHGVPMVRWAMWWLAIAAPFHVQMVLMGSLSGNIHRCPQRCLPCE